MFIERNGQRFDGFRLPYAKDEFELQQIVWSNVADCLVILGVEHHLEQNSEQEADRQVLLIYSMRNFHWYCKQRLAFEKVVDGQIKRVINQNQLTNEFEPLNLLFLFDSGKIGEFVYSNQINSNADGDCALIDGKNLLFTPFHHSSIPPPMYGYSLQFNDEINEVCFSQPTGNYLLVKLSNQTLHLIKRNEAKKIELDKLLSLNINLNFQSISFKQPNLPLIYASSCNHFESGAFKVGENLRQSDEKLKNANIMENCYQLNLTDQKVCYALSSLKKDELIRLDFENNKSTRMHLGERSIELICLNNSKSNQFLALVEKNGLVWKLNLARNESSSNESSYESHKLEQFKMANEQQIRLKNPIESIVKFEVLDDRCILSLTNSYDLCINHLPIQSSDCNSFLIHNSNLLMYTTNDHHLRSIWLDDIYYYMEAIDLPDFDNGNQKFRFLKEAKQAGNRTVERGSRLVTSCLSDCKLILQMPRGNLEIITPRILVLDRLKLLLGTLQYNLAFQFAKKHRINLNLIVDFDLNCFLLNVKNFIAQISDENTTDLCLFLSELSEDNVLNKLYSIYNQTQRQLSSNLNVNSLFDCKFPELKSKQCNANLGDQHCVDGKVVHFDHLLNQSDLKGNNKLDAVSSSLRDAMFKLGEQKYFIPILLTYLKQSKPSIGTALMKIYEKGDKELRLKSLNYLKYIIEMHNLIKESLSTYDLNVAKMVYSISNLDPKEYLPLLAKLEAYELKEYRNYQIDLHLKHYEKALQSLSDCKPFTQYANEAIELIEQKHLYETAIELFSKNEECSRYLNQIYSSYGDYLLVKKYFNEALLVFKKGENYSNAIKAAQLTNNWNQIIECASLASEQIDKLNDADKADKQINLTKIYQSIAEQLDNFKDAKNCSFIYSFYLNDWHQAIRVLIRNYYWADAFRLLNDKQFILNVANEDRKSKLTKEQLDELTCLADQTLNKHYEEIVDNLNESFGELKKYTERLQKVRENKRNVLEQMSLADNLNELEDEFLNDQSTISTVSSVQSGRRKNLKRNSSSSQQSQTNSLATNKSFARKRKEKSNKYRLREGSRDENLALVYHIRLRIKSIEKLKKTIKLLILTLVDRRFDVLANRLIKVFSKLLEVVQFVITIVWYQVDDMQVNEFSLNTDKKANAIQGKFRFKK